MNNEASNDEEREDPFSEYAVVKNANGDHSIWPTLRDIPLGWTSLGITGSKDHCLDWIEKNWEGPKVSK